MPVLHEGSLSSPSGLDLFLLAQLEPQAECDGFLLRVGARVGGLELAHPLANYRCTVTFCEG